MVFTSSANGTITRPACGVSSRPKGRPRLRPIYASHASDAFNERMDGVLQELTVDVHGALGNNLVALLLGGGYGRGEGGVVWKHEMERPYNDLDLTLVVKRKGAVPQDALAAISRAYESRIGIEIDFSRPVTMKEIRRWPHCLMWFDLLHGHIVLWGPEDILHTQAPDSLRSPLPPVEATRLLLNRGAGVLWALRVARGIEPPPDSDFLRRNFYKCALALGDALLIAHQRFSTPYGGRDLMLERLFTQVDDAPCPNLLPLYRKALQFKFQPDALPKDMGESLLNEMAALWGEIFLRVENLRTGRAWPSLGAYVEWRGVREPKENTMWKWPRNFLLNRRWGITSVRYPREGLYCQLPVLLGLTGGAIVDWAEATDRFLRMWKRFN